VAHHKHSARHGDPSKSAGRRSNGCAKLALRLGNRSRGDWTRSPWLLLAAKAEEDSLGNQCAGGRAAGSLTTWVKCAAADILRLPIRRTGAGARPQPKKDSPGGAEYPGEANQDSTFSNEISCKDNALAFGTRLEIISMDRDWPCSKWKRSLTGEIETMANAFEYNPQMETYEAGEFEWSGEAEWGGEVFSEAETMELAGELLEVTNEAELDRFLGDLIKKAGKAVGSFVRSPVGNAIGGWLKGAAKQLLPVAGGALGGFVGGPLGAQIGSGLASKAGSALGLEAEMSQEDREFEGAKQFVKMAADAVKTATAAPAAAHPVTVAKAAVKAAVEKHAPGLLSGNGVAHRPAGKLGHTGRWVRHGRNVVIVNCG
jgi:hypothetical protein